MPVDLMLLSIMVAVASAEPDAPVQKQEPDMELLEFLGEWETAAGGWLNPETLTYELPAREGKEKPDE